MIIKYEHPETDPEQNKFLNKFIGKNGEGYRGNLIATNQARNEGIILFSNNLILVKEKNPNEYPTEIKTILDLSLFLSPMLYD